MELIKNHVKVAWDNLNEGMAGGYDPDDPNDTNVLRLDVFIKEKDSDEWWSPQDWTCCTLFAASASDEIKQKALQFCMDCVYEAAEAEYNDSLTWNLRKNGSSKLTKPSCKHAKTSHSNTVLPLRSAVLDIAHLRLRYGSA